jgi:hypothetical protein
MYPELLPYLTAQGLCRRNNWEEDVWQDADLKLNHADCTGFVFVARNQKK